MARLHGSEPARRLRVSGRNLVGSIAVDGGRVTFESPLERDFLLLLDFDSRVLDLQVQPFSIYHQVGDSRRRYTPDVLARFQTDGGLDTVVYEVKPAETLREKWHEFKPRFAAATRHCRSNGWRFKIVTERRIRTPYLANVKFLRGYRSVQADATIEGQLLYTFKALGPTTPQALLAAAYWSVENRLQAIPYLWKLVLDQKIGVDLQKPLTMSSVIWMVRK